MRQFLIGFLALFLAVGSALGQPISALTESTAPGANSWIEIADMDATPKSRKFALEDLLSIPGFYNGPLALAGGAQGLMGLGDGDNSHTFSWQANATITTSLNYIGPAAPATGLFYATHSGTNANVSHIANGTEGQVLKAGVSGVPAFSDGPVYTIEMVSQVWGPAANQTYYHGGAGNTPVTTQGRYASVVGVAGTIIGYTFSVYGSAGDAVNQVIVRLAVNNGTAFGSDTFAWSSFPVRRSFVATSQAVAVNDYLEAQIVTPATWTPATGVGYKLIVYIRH